MVLFKLVPDKGYKGIWIPKPTSLPYPFVLESMGMPVM